MRRSVVPVVLVLWLALPARADAPEVQPLLQLEAAVQAVVDRAAPMTVAVQVGAATGSGVVVSGDGVILTAGHVSGRPGRSVTVIFPDGTRARGRTLGSNIGLDCGMMRITDDPPEGGWPHAEIAEAGSLSRGDWVVALGHPGGFSRDRPYVARLGQIRRARASSIISDCTLIGGDSGGPLFDLAGHVVGIHSRIGISTAQNVHVPIAVYHDSWTRLADGEQWGDWRGRRRQPVDPDAPFLGIAGRDHRRGVEITRVVPGSAAEKAGLLGNDVVTAIDGRPVEDYTQLIGLLRESKVDQTIRIVILRDAQPMTLQATLTRRGDVTPQDAPDPDE